jgi:hypothetical protein
MADIMKRTLFSSSLFLVVSGAFLAGCGTEPLPEPLIHTPGTGSAYHFTNFDKDSTGEKISSSQTSSTRTIVANNATVVGKTGVVQFAQVTNGQTGADTSSLHYEGNGDVMFLQPAIVYPSDQFPAMPGVPIPNLNIPARWVLLPFGTKVETVIPGYDTTLTIPGIPLPINLKVSGTAAYVKDEELTIGSEKLATQKGLVTINIQFSAFLVGTGTIKTTDSIWFAPKLGMFIKDDALTTSEMPAQFGTSGIMGGTYSIMTSYTMK